MQAYGKSFAKIYNLRWGSFARNVAPRVQEVYESSPLGQTEKSLLDVCCGAGHLIQHFTGFGYRAVGIDLSKDMLAYARQNNLAAVVAGLAGFIQADASSFQLETSFGLAVSTFDALNHLPGLDALAGCFRSVYEAVLPGGMFLFDLNTRLGLMRWQGAQVDDSEEMLLFTRGVVDETSGRAFTAISGFLRQENGLYERFTQNAYNTIFDMHEVEQTVREAGWSDVYMSSMQDLSTPLEDPESEGRVFFICRKPASG